MYGGVFDTPTKVFYLFIYLFIRSFTGERIEQIDTDCGTFYLFLLFIRSLFERFGELTSNLYHVVQFYLLVRCKLENTLFISVYSLVVNWRTTRLILFYESKVERSLVFTFLWTRPEMIIMRSQKSIIDRCKN